MTAIYQFTHAIVLAALALVCFPQVNPQAASPSEFYLISVEECGNLAREGHLVRGENGEIPVRSAPGASLEERTYSGGDVVVYRYSGLPSSEKYKLRVVYLSDRDGRVVKLSAGGVQLDEPFKEPQHQPAKREIEVPASAIHNGVLELRFEKAGAENVYVNEIELWSTRGKISRNLLLSTQGNSRGEITGTVTDWLYKPVPRSSIQVHYSPAREVLSATTDNSGRFSIRAPLAWRSSATELVTVRASHAGFIASAEISSLEVYPPEIRLTPRPITVSGLEPPKMDLGGTWNFVVQAPPNFWEQGAVPASQINHIQVPGEWAMQGFTVPRDGAAGYWRTVEVPRGWAGKRIKLKCDAVFSLAEVWVNGKKVGQFEGGFTPFEFDVTEDVEAGEVAIIALRVQQDTMAAGLSAMINYAQHDLGGITRKILLFAVPEVNIFRAHAETRFDSQYQNATLRLTLGVANQGQSTVEGAELRLRLADPDGKAVSLSPASAGLPALRAGEDRVQVVDIPVTKPLHWENEHPRLYRLEVDLIVGGSTVETVARRVGFRQVEIRGNQFLLNGHAIKFHGVERHETNPVLGRSLKPEIWDKEVPLLHEANMNYVFTSHYPVPEEFLDLCDEVGLLVTEELPAVWVGEESIGNAPDGSTDPRYYKTMASNVATTLEKDRSHPSIVFWQSCDECAWGRNFAGLHALFDALDPGRPVNFANEAGTSKFFSQHYPSIDDARKVPADGPKPVIYDQYTHINNYNRRENLTDPGLRDYYGKAIAPMWDVMYSNPGIAGGAIWEWSNDVFYVPASGHNQNRFHGDMDAESGRWLVGYGPWGIVDSWLRKKPEFWIVKKTYSPVRIQEHEPIPSPAGGLLRIPVENRYDFTNLNELRLEWSANQRKGTATANVPPRSKGWIEIQLPEGAFDIHDLTLKVFNREELVDAYDLPVGDRKAEEKTGERLEAAQQSAPQFEETEKSITVRGRGLYWEFDRRTGLVVAGGTPGASASIMGGPYLAVTPLEVDPCCPQIVGPVTPLQPPIMPWTTSSVTAQMEGTSVLIRITGTYPEYRGDYTIRLDPSRRVTLDYRFEYNGAESAIRELGLLFDVPAGMDILHWNHKTQWSYYPEGHIGRPEGSAAAFRNPLEWAKAVFGNAPPWPWELDSTAGGTNDFRSTKFNIYWASLTDAEGRGTEIDSDGQQNVRAWFDQDRIRLLVTDFSKGGGEPFLRLNHYGSEQKALHKGDVISGTVRLRLAGGSQ
jgi:hypothetical protein